MPENSSYDCPKEVIEQLKQSNQEAFFTVFRLFSPVVYRFAFNFLKSQVEAEEIAQETFIRIWEKRTTIDPCNSFSGFIFTVARHLTLNRIRKIRNENRCKADLAEMSISNENQIEEMIFEAELKKAQQSALEELSPRRKLIYQMIREEGMSYKQVAQQLNISVKTVESQMTEVMKHFRAKLTL